MNIYEMFEKITDGKLKYEIKGEKVVIGQYSNNEFKGIIWDDDKLIVQYNNASLSIRNNAIRFIKNYDDLYDSDEYVFEEKKLRVNRYRLDEEDTVTYYNLPESFRKIILPNPTKPNLIIESIKSEKKSYYEYFGKISENDINQLIIRKNKDTITISSTSNGDINGYSFVFGKTYICVEYNKKNLTNGLYSHISKSNSQIGYFINHDKLNDSHFSEYLYIYGNSLNLSINENDKRFSYKLNDEYRRNITKKETQSDHLNDYCSESKSEKKEVKKITKKEIDEAFKSLDDLIGLDTIKDELYSTCCLAIKNKRYRPNLHMAFLGNPGTGKTEVGKRIASIFFKCDVLPTDKFTRVTREDLVGEHIGKTEKKVKDIIEASIGGVLFIDEAYNLFQEDDSLRDYGVKAIDVLVNTLEEYQGKFCCIFAGYPYEMEYFFKANPGLNSRIPNKVKFRDYNRLELIKICKNLLCSKDYIAGADVINDVVDMVELKRKSRDFANAREVRNVLEQLYRIQAKRTVECENNRTITLEDMGVYKKKNNIEIKPDSFNKLDFNDVSKGITYDNKMFNIKDSDTKEAICYIKGTNGNNILEGSGFLFTNNGYILTCAHVVADCEKVEIERKIYDTKFNIFTLVEDVDVLYFDKSKDIAILKTKSNNKSYPHLNLADYRIPELSNIVMIGYPLGKSTYKEMSYSKGFISSYQNIRGKSIISLNITALEGFSGSAIIDLNTSKVIGILKGAYQTKSSALPFAVNIDEVLDIINQVEDIN